MVLITSITMAKLGKKEESAINRFIEPYLLDNNVIGIILCGSHIHSNAHKNSDLDIHIVLKTSNTRERGNTFVLGKEIEYFINPVNQIKEYFKEESKPHNNPNTAHMFSNCIVLYQKGKTLDSLRKKAKQIIKKEHGKFKSVEIELAKYELDDLRKDLDDMVDIDDELACVAICGQILDSCVKNFYRIKRKHKVKTKRNYDNLKKLDKKFASLYKSAALETKLHTKVKKMNSLINYTEKLLGGRRSKEWKLKSKLTTKL